MKTARITPPRLAGLTLRANFRWTFAGNVVHAASYWGVLTVLAKLGSAEVVGKFVFGLAVAAPVMAIVMLQLRSVQATDAAGAYAFADYFGTRIVMTILGLMVIAGIALLGREEHETAWVVFLVGLNKCIECISEVIRGLFQRHERMDICGGGLMIKGLLTLGTLSAAYWLTRDLITGVTCMVAVGALVLAFYDLPLAARLLERWAGGRSEFGRVAPSFTPSIVARLVWRALPLGLGAFLLALQTNLPRYILESYHSEAALGYFGAMAFVIAIGSITVSAIGQAASPRLANIYLTDPTGFRRLFAKLMFIGAALGALSITAVGLLGRPLLTILYAPEYAAYSKEFVILAAAGALMFLANLCGYALTATQIFRVQLTTGAITSGLVWVPAFLLVPAYGVGGAAVTSLLMSAVVLTCYLVGLFAILGHREHHVDRGGLDNGVSHV